MPSSTGRSAYPVSVDLYPRSVGAGTNGRSALPPPLLEIDDLSVSFPSSGEQSAAVTGLSLYVEESEFVGVVGESGSGKSITAQSIMRILPDEAMWSGTIRFMGNDLTSASEGEMRAIRGSQISMVFQNPMSGLNPVMSVGAQLTDTLAAHDRGARRAARARAAELLELVDLPHPRRTLSSYPHELSGGMQQRVMIAMALAHNPRLLIADEPTTALDVTIEAQIMEVLQRARDATGAAVLLITHNLGLVANLADRIYVMYAGQVYETGRPEDIFFRSQSPYTRALLRSQPRIEADGRSRLEPIRGVLRTRDLTGGCGFRLRCDYAADICEQKDPHLVPTGAALHESRCLRLGQLAAPTEKAGDSRDAEPPYVPPPGAPVAIEARDLSTVFRTWRGFRRYDISAVDQVSVVVKRGETLSIVGESGSGKTTLGRTLARLVDPSHGEIWLEGSPITALGGRRLRDLRQVLQVVFQDPYGSLNPRLGIGQSIREPLQLLGVPRSEIAGRVTELIRRVGLPESLLDRRPAQLSGGQLQRVGIARALALSARVIVLDEPVSALDLSIQAEILNLLQDLQQQHELSYLFITHDLSVTKYISHRVAVMYLGRIVETASTGALFDAPAHPYTQALLSAVPIADPRLARQRQRIVLKGERPDPANPPNGCRFHTRCPIAKDRCSTEEPEWQAIAPERFVACHFPLEIPTRKQT